MVFEVDVKLVPCLNFYDFATFKQLCHDCLYVLVLVSNVCYFISGIRILINFPTMLHCTLGTGLLNSQRSRGRYLLSKTVNPADPKSKTQQQAALGKETP